MRAVFVASFHLVISVSAAPFFEIRHPSVTHYRSGVFERANKRDRHIDMELSAPVVLCGDVMIEFFNKPRMMKKVSDFVCSKKVVSFSLITARFLAEVAELIV